MEPRHEKRQDCPCKRPGCPRHGDCAACVAYHRQHSRFPVACRRERQRKQDT